MVNFDVSADDAEIILKIAGRAARLFGVGVGSRIELSMDVTAVHANGCPLRLAELLEAPDFDFTHDVTGIRRHLDRKTGQLTGFFVPRHAVPENPTAAELAYLKNGGR